MLHAPTLKIFSIKEVPVSNREQRMMLKEWIGQWEKYCTSDQFVRIYGSFWNSPEGCVSVITDYAASGSLYNLSKSVGALPEKILKNITKSIIAAVEPLHRSGVAHNGIKCS